MGDAGGRAALWRGTPESRINLGPATALSSVALGVRGDMQVGLTVLPGSPDERASLWRGTAESFVNLHPPLTTRSQATATDGTFQGGWVDTPQRHAFMWDATAASARDLHPGGPYSTSEIFGMAPGIQVGGAFTINGQRAGVWHGTAASFEDWNPPGASYSLMRATTGSIHVGRAGLPGAIGQSACAWLGSPSNIVNLHALLPPNYGLSEALAVWEGPGVVYIVGWGDDNLTASKHAFMWVGVPAPGAASLLLSGAILAVRRRRPYARRSSGDTSSAVLG
ncbi:MAG: hypothetical protein JNM80_13460 [Phycisphaerae bacterium]|nr:hypothetical protein [Phycisphaerae bacterium]